MQGFTEVSDLDFNILLHLDAEDLLTVCQTNKYFNHYCRDDYFWKTKVNVDPHIRRIYNKCKKLLSTIELLVKKKKDFIFQEVETREMIWLPENFTIYDDEKQYIEISIKKRGKFLYYINFWSLADEVYYIFDYGMPAGNLKLHRRDLVLFLTKMFYFHPHVLFTDQDDFMYEMI